MARTTPIRGGRGRLKTMSQVAASLDRKARVAKEVPSEKVVEYKKEGYWGFLIKGFGYSATWEVKYATKEDAQFAMVMARTMKNEGKSAFEIGIALKKTFKEKNQ